MILVITKNNGNNITCVVQRVVHHKCHKTLYKEPRIYIYIYTYLQETPRVDLRCLANLKRYMVLRNHHLYHFTLTISDIQAGCRIIISYLIAVFIEKHSRRQSSE